MPDISAVPTAPPRPGFARRTRLRLADAWGALADRAGLDAGLIDFAVRFPLTRPVARRRASALFDLCAGFVYSQVLLGCVRLDLFARLRGGPRSLADLARDTALTESAARTLCEAATALRLLRRAGPDRYRLGPLGRAALLDPGVPAMVEHHAMLYGDLADPVALLRGEARPRALEGFWSYSGAADARGSATGRTAAYTRLMAASQAMVSREVLRAYSFARHRRIVDVAGGDGSFLEAVARAAPALDLVLFDLPSVAAEAEARFARAGLGDRSRAVGGDFRHDALPSGADLATLVRVLHDHDDHTVASLLMAVRRALSPGGTLLVAEPMAEAPGAERVGGAYFGFYLLAMGQGRARTAAELTRMLHDAGFSDVERRATALPLVAGMLVARTPGRSVNLT